MSSVDDVLKKAASGGKKKKEATPVVQIPIVTQAVKDWLKAAKEYKDAESRKAEAEAIFLVPAENERIKASRADGKYYTSVCVNGDVVVTVQNKYSAIPSSDEDKLKEAFGMMFDRYFKKSTAIALTEKASEGKELLAKLIELVGEEKFGEIFVVTQTYKPTEEFHQARVLDAAVTDKFRKLAESEVIKPFKASCKAQA